MKNLWLSRSFWSGKMAAKIMKIMIKIKIANWAAPADNDLANEASKVASKTNETADFVCTDEATKAKSLDATMSKVVVFRF